MTTFLDPPEGKVLYEVTPKIHPLPQAGDERGLSQAPQTPSGAAGTDKMRQEFGNLAAQVLGPKLVS